jgi:hypothetical protein
VNYFRSALPDVAITIRRIVADRDNVVGWWTATRHVRTPRRGRIGVRAYLSERDSRSCEVRKSGEVVIRQFATRSGAPSSYGGDRRLSSGS